MKISITPKAAELKTVLMILDHVEENGPSIERLKVSALPFWGTGRPEKLAQALDRVFTRLRRATAAAEAEWRLSLLLEQGRREGRDMVWLGDGITRLYRFPGNGATLMRRAGPVCPLVATPSGIMAAAR